MRHSNNFGVNCVIDVSIVDKFKNILVVGDFIGRLQ